MCPVNIDPYNQELIAFFLLVLPAAFYITALYEDRRSLWLFTIGLAIHAASILERWAYTARLPLSEKHDNISLMAFALAALYLYLTAYRKMRNISLGIPLLACALIFVAMVHRPFDTISPFMQTPWFYLHASCYFLSYALFGASACLGIQYALQGTPEHEEAQYRLVSTGWILMSASLLFGSIWFYKAYGTYWLWTSKEMWISATWLYFGIYLHARLMSRLRGRTAAIIGSLGYAVALFAYFGVGTIIPSPPTQF